MKSIAFLPPFASLSCLQRVGVGIELKASGSSMKLNSLSLAVALLAIETATLSAQTVTLLHNFTNSPDGATPFAGLLLSGGTFYGTTEKGGPDSVGTVFAVNIDGTGYRVLHNFADEPDGSHPLAGLVLSGNTLYGATGNGGTNGWGTLFWLNTNGDGYGYGVLYNFNLSSNGVLPNARLALAGGTLYGVASGDGYGTPGWGTVFSIKTDGSDYTPLYNFSTPHGLPLTNADGEQPQAGLMLSGDTLYGTAYGGGTNGYGTVYSVRTNGTNFSVLHAFSNNPDGAYPQAGLLLAGDTLFGTTQSGGTNGKGTVFAVSANGTGYGLLHSFATNGLDGMNPRGGLTLSGRTLHGTTQTGGSSGHGTVFSIQTNSTCYSVLYNFTNTPDGSDPESALVLSGNRLYGTTDAGGSSVWGTVFRLTVPVLDITSFTLVGTNLVLNADNGVVGGTYTVLMSTNLGLPLSQWTPVATSVLAGSGNFTITATNAVSPGAPQQFYVLQAQ
jgi:uncharacterized repeat protein (TIGR03803 family)